MMQIVLLLVILFLIAVILILGVVFAYIAFRIFNFETNTFPDKSAEDVIGDRERTPLDQFMPKPGPVKVKYEKKDIITKI